MSYWMQEAIEASYQNLIALQREKQELRSQFQYVIEFAKYDFQVYWRVYAFMYDKSYKNFDARNDREIAMIFEAKRIKRKLKRIEFHIAELEHDIDSLANWRDYDEAQEELEALELQAQDYLHDIQDALMAS